MVKTNETLKARFDDLPKRKVVKLHRLFKCIFYFLEFSSESICIEGTQVFFWKKASPNQQKHAKEKRRREQNPTTESADPNPDLTGNDITNPMKGRMARRPERWFPLNGPAIVIGHEWDEKRQCDSYWLAYGGSCTLVPGSHMRHAEMEDFG